MVIGKTSPYFHFPIIFPWKWPDTSFKKKIIIQEALEPSFVDTGGGVLEKIRMEQINTCMYMEGQTNRQTDIEQKKVHIRSDNTLLNFI